MGTHLGDTMSEVPVTKVLFYESTTRKVYRGDDNLKELFFSSHERAVDYVKSRRLAVGKIVESRLKAGDPRIDMHG